LIDRLDGYGRTLDGAAVSSSLVTAQEWKFTSRHAMEARLPEILGVGYIALVDDAKTIIISNIHWKMVLFPPIHPVTGQDERYVVQFIEPLTQMGAALERISTSMRP
jgi:CHASE1-domain containing sensor protein